MSIFERINPLVADPEQLELAYREALQVGDADSFAAAIRAGHAAAPDNLLYAAWFYRLKYAAVQAKAFVVAWAWAAPLAVACGLLFWVLSGDRFMIQIAGTRPGSERDFLPTIILVAAPIAGAFVLAYLTAAGRRDWRLSLLVGVALLAAGGYVLLFYPQTGSRPFQEQYLTLMAIHLPLLAWAGVGAFLIVRHRDPANRFAFLIKSLEVFIVGGLFAIAGGIFTVITVLLFEALDVTFPETAQRLFIAGGAGLIAIVAPAVIYNPAAPPAEQSFDEGLSKVVALLMRVMLPLTLLVLIVYLVFIPFNFRAPFDNREVLIIYNGALFAVIALLAGATPVIVPGRGPGSGAEMSPRLARWLRAGIIAVAALALIVSIYALAAILYRTALDRMTPNRLTFIGWNVVNILLLALILILQEGAGKGRWVHGLYRAFSAGTLLYTGWALVVILALPWLFGNNQGDTAALPAAVQDIVYEFEDPILLKCAGSPHIYLLDGGEKRWIDSIQTFDDRGYVWRDVQFISCAELRTIPDGEPIPADAGPVPQP